MVSWVPSLLALVLTHFSGITSDKILISADSKLYMTDTEQNTTAMLYDVTSSVSSIDYHYKKDYLYYTQGNYIMRRNISSNVTEHSLKLIYTGTVYGLAVDWINDHIYWTNSHGNEILVADLDGSERTQIIGPEDFEEGLAKTTILYDINLDPYEAVMFAIAGDNRGYLKGTLVSAFLNGDSFRSISDPVYKPIITFGIDYHDQRLYVTGGKDLQEFVYCCDYNGVKVSEAYPMGTKMWVNPLRVFLDKLYLLHNYDSAGSVVKDQLFRTSLASYGSNNSYDRIDTTGLSHIYDMRICDEKAQMSVVAFRIYQSKRRSEPQLVTSTTPENLPLNSSNEGVTETVTTGDMILISADSGIVITDTEQKNTTLLYYDEMKGIFSIDYHFSKGYLYYSLGNYIMRRNITSHSTEESLKLVYTGIVCGLAVDWINNHIYWTNSNKDEVYVAELDGSQRKTIIGRNDFEGIDLLENNNHFYDINLDPYKGVIFFIAGDKRRILDGTLVTAHLNGDSLRTISDDVYKNVITFGIDYHDQRLYVTGGKDERAFVYSCDYNGSKVSEVYPMGTAMWMNPLRVYLDNLYLLLDNDSTGRHWRNRLYRTSLASYTSNDTYEKIDIAGLLHIHDMRIYNEKAQMSMDDFQTYQSKRRREPQFVTSTPASLPIDSSSEGDTLKETASVHWTHRKNVTLEDVQHKKVTKNMTSLMSLEDSTTAESSRLPTYVNYIAMVLVFAVILGALFFILKRYHFGNIQRLFDRKRLTPEDTDSIELDD